MFGKARESWFLQRSGDLQAADNILRNLFLAPGKAKAVGLKLNQDGRKRSAFELLSYPDISWDDLANIWPQLDEIDPSVQASMEVDARYSVYLQRQERDIRNYNKEQSLKIPRDFDFAAISGLSNEIRQKLERIRPLTLGQALKIDGMDASSPDDPDCSFEKEASHQSGRMRTGDKRSFWS